MDRYKKDRDGVIIVLYCSFSLIKKNEKIKAVFKSCDFALLGSGFAPKLVPPTSGLKHGCSQPPPRAQNRDLNKAVPKALGQYCDIQAFPPFGAFYPKITLSKK